MTTPNPAESPSAAPPGPTDGVAVSCRGVRKSFGADDVLAGLDLDLPAGRITCLLGPSGVGKTTLARCLAGLDQPDAGRIVCGDETFNDPASRVPPHRRRVGMIFQGLALWPHRTVAGHLRVALRGRRVPRRDRAARIRATLDLVGLTPLASRYPSRLSGGEQQRLAIARALCDQPRLLIADEPFAGFEETVRAPIRDEIRRLTADAGLTTLFITHDRAEALALADHVAVIRAGRVEQCGPPAELWHRPASGFVARFVGGHSLLPATRREDGTWETPAGVVAASNADAAADRTVGRAVFDRARVRAHPTSTPGWPATVVSCAFAGDGWTLDTQLADGATLGATAAGPVAVGETVHLTLPDAVPVVASE